MSPNRTNSLEKFYYRILSSFWKATQSRSVRSSHSFLLSISFKFALIFISFFSSSAHPVYLIYGWACCHEMPCTDAGEPWHAYPPYIAIYHWVLGARSSQKHCVQLSISLFVDILASWTVGVFREARILKILYFLQISLTLVQCSFHLYNWHVLFFIKELNIERKTRH